MTSNIPSNWELSTLGEVSEKPQYGWTTKANHENGSVKLLRTTDITSGELDWASVPFCTDVPEDEDKYLLHPGDIVISRAGSVGFSYLLTSTEKAVFASYLIRFRIKEGIEKKYVYYFLKSPDYWKAIGASKLGIAVQNVNATKLAQVQIPIAPLEQQKRIVAEIEKQFSRLDEAVFNLKRVKANLKRYKAAALKSAVEGKLTEKWREEQAAKLAAQGSANAAGDTKSGAALETAEELLKRILVERRQKWEEAELAKMKAKGKTPKDDTWKKKYKEPECLGGVDFTIPQSWAVATVQQLAERVQYGSSSKTNEDESGIPVLRMGNIFEGELSLKKLKYLPPKHNEFPELLLDEDDLLFNRTNSPELVGKTAVYKGKPTPCSFASYLIRVRMMKGVESKFVSYYINSMHGRQWVKAVVTQQVGQANVNGTKLQALIIPVPPAVEQKAIVSEMETSLSLMSEMEIAVDTNLLRAESLRQSILRKAFSGAL